MIKAGALGLIAGALITASLAASAQQFGAQGVGPATVRTLGDKQLRSRSHDPQTDQEQRPQRVVSSSLLSDELLEGVLPWKYWAGVSYVVDWASATPASALFPQEVPRTSGTSEDLLIRQADLIVISPYNDALTFAQLKTMNLPLHVVKVARNYEELFAEWLRLGRAVHEEAAAQIKIKKARHELKQIRAIASSLKRHPRALLLQGMFSYGGQTLQGRCLQEAGLQNALHSSASLSPQLNVEYILGLAPEILFVAAEVDKPQPATPEQLPPGDFWQALPAVRKSQVFAIPGAWMASISQHSLLACRAYAELAQAVDSRSSKNSAQNAQEQSP